MDTESKKDVKALAAMFGGSSTKKAPVFAKATSDLPTFTGNKDVKSMAAMFERKATVTKSSSTIEPSKPALATAKTLPKPVLQPPQKPVA